MLTKKKKCKTSRVAASVSHKPGAKPAKSHPKKVAPKPKVKKHRKRKKRVLKHVAVHTAHRRCGA